MFYIIEFILAFVIVYLIYFFIKKRYFKRIDKRKLPTEIRLFTILYKVDVKKVGYKKLFRDISLINSFSVSSILLLTNLVNSMWVKLLLAVCLCIVFIIVTYFILGKIYKKKGLVLDV